MDLPVADPAVWSGALAALLCGADAAAELPRRLALRQGYWWRQALLPVPVPAATVSAALPAAPATYLVIGGTGGIGRSLAAWLLTHSECRVVLLSRGARLPEDLAPWADRVELVEADLAEEALDVILSRIAAHTRGSGGIDGVVHAAGSAGGGLISRRDSAAMRQATAAKLRGTLLVERLIEDYRPGFAAYCSSMSAQYGGVGQFDYAAANGLLDGFARYRSDATATTLRIGIGWDIWSEVGMARDALRSDARHQKHLTVGLAIKEGQRLFARALQLQLPHLLVSTTDIERARDFYAPSAAPGAVPRTRGADVPQDEARPEAIAARLSGWLRDWLGLDEIDPAVSLYDHGVDSLTMLDLVAKIEQHYGVVLELSQLGHRISLNGVLALAEQAEAAGPGAAPPADQVPIEVWQEGTGNDVVCLIHPVGGDVQAYRALVSVLDRHLTVCLIADPALRSPERPSWSLAERARHYHAALRARFPQGPWRWHLAGWSFGAWVAHAVAAEAEAAGHPAAQLDLLDPPPPDAAPHFLAYDEARYAAVFAHELSQGGTDGNRATAGPGPEALAYAERLARCCRANVAAMAHHQPPRLTRTRSRLWLATRPVDGLPVLGSPEEQRRLWQERLPLLDGFHALDTTHYGVVRTPWVQAVANAVNITTGTAASPPARTS